MAFLIGIEKIEETDTRAIFSFSDEGYQSGTGQILLDKGTGEITLVQPAPYDPNDAIARRAALKVYRTWKQDAALPRFLVWAS